MYKDIHIERLGIGSCFSPPGAKMKEKISSIKQKIGIATTQGGRE